MDLGKGTTSVTVILVVVRERKLKTMLMINILIQRQALKPKLVMGHVVICR